MGQGRQKVEERWTTVSKTLQKVNRRDDKALKEATKETKF